MSSKRCPDELKIEAVKQVVDRGHSVADVAGRLGMTTHSLYAWIKKFGPDSAEHSAKADVQAEIRRLKELKRATEERDLLQKAAVYFANQPDCGTPLSSPRVRHGWCGLNVFLEWLWRSVKYEEVYLKAYDDIRSARASLGNYFEFYNSERRHQSLDRRTPDQGCYDNATRMAARVKRWNALIELSNNRGPLLILHVRVAFVLLMLFPNPRLNTNILRGGSQDV